MRIIETKVYKIQEHPNKDKCYSWMRDNLHDINQHSVYEVIDSIKKLSQIIGGNVDYSIGQFPVRGEHIIFTDYDKDKLMELDASDCLLTGVFWDYDLIIGMQENDPYKVLRSLHRDSEHKYSDDGLLDKAKINEYEFTEDGKLTLL